MRALQLALLVGLWPSSAWAFCGTYVGSGESVPSNRASQIAIARDGAATTLTLFNDFEGELADFGMVIPVPPGFDEGNLRLADRALLARLDQYSAPRMVAYDCEAFYDLDQDGVVAAVATRSVHSKALADADDGDTGRETGDTGAASSSTASGCGGSGSSSSNWFEDGDDPDTGDDPVREDTGNGVVVEDEFNLGEYTASVVRAEDGDGLAGWLADNGFSAPASTTALLDEYVSGGSWFLALAIDVEQTFAKDGWLTPLQLGYSSELFSLPIQLGAASSAGVQDLLIYTLGPAGSGTVAVSNYPEQPLPAGDCLLALAPQESLTDAWEDVYEGLSGLPDDPLALEPDQGGFSWTTEYSWDSGKCDPCPEDLPLSTDDVMALGMGTALWGYHFTRLHLRYTPDAVIQDLGLYQTGITEQKQVRFIQHAWELESELPMCSGETPESPGACYTAEYWARRSQGADAEVLPVDDDFRTWLPGVGCSEPPGRTVMLLPLLLAFRRRERS